jgi:hypothetical protein
VGALVVLGTAPLVVCCAVCTHVLLKTGVLVLPPLAREARLVAVHVAAEGTKADCVEFPRNRLACPSRVSKSGTNTLGRHRYVT